MFLRTSMRHLSECATEFDSDVHVSLYIVINLVIYWFELVPSLPQNVYSSVEMLNIVLKENFAEFQLAVCHYNVKKQMNSVKPISFCLQPRVPCSSAGKSRTVDWTTDCMCRPTAFTVHRSFLLLTLHCLTKHRSNGTEQRSNMKQDSVMALTMFHPKRFQKTHF